MTADSRSIAKSPATATREKPGQQEEGRPGSREPPGACGEEREPRRVDDEPAEDLGGGGDVRFPRKPAGGVAGHVIGHRKGGERDERERQQDHRDEHFAKPETDRLGRRDVPVEMTIAEAEPAEALIVASQPQQNLLVALRISGAQPFHARRNRPAAGDAIRGVSGASASRGVQPVHALDERCVRLGIGFDQQTAHVLRDPIRQRAYRRRLRVRPA